MLTGTTKNGLDVNQGIDELETPSFLQRLKEADENLKVSFYSSDTEFSELSGVLPILKERLRPTVKPLMLLLLKSMVKQSRIS